ncbi:MAG: YbjN domain-containing protein [Candidatus Hodarchaeota archaeon]
MTTMDKIEDFLKQMNLTYRVVPEEDRILLPYQIKDRRFMLVVDRGDKWVRFFTIIVEAANLKSVNKLDLYTTLLEANGQLAEVKYFITDEGAVGVIGHEGIQNLTFEGFQEEYNALPFAVSYFIENVAPKLQIDVPGIE